MNDMNWMIKVETSLTEIKSDIKYMIEKLPECEKKSIKSAIRLNRKLIFVILASYLPVIIYLFVKP